MNTIEVANFNLKHILNSGQSFNWSPFKDGYIGIFQNFAIFTKQKNTTLFWEATSDSINIEWIKKYFNLDFSHSTFKQEINDTCEIAANAVKAYSGLRILNQDPTQTILSFILATNKSIKAIKNAIHRLSVAGGKKAIIRDTYLYLFPHVEYFATATLNELQKSGVGYRATYLQKTANMMLEKNVVTLIKNSKTLHEKKAILLELPGVGKKVADCILSFSFGELTITPIDRWSERIVHTVYSRQDIKKYDAHSNFFSSKFGNNTALAGLYLFEMIRNNTQ